MYLGADTATCDQDKARLFNKFFFSVFNNKNAATEFNEYTTFNCTSNAILSDVVVTVSDVYELWFLWTKIKQWDRMASRY